MNILIVAAVGVVDQGREGLDGDRSVYDEITGGSDFLNLGSQEVSSRAYCSWFGFKSGDQQKKVSTLSGGERNRCQLAKVVKSGANVLLLDGENKNCSYTQHQMT